MDNWTVRNRNERAQSFSTRLDLHGELRRDTRYIALFIEDARVFNDQFITLCMVSFANTMHIYIHPPTAAAEWGARCMVHCPHIRQAGHFPQVV